MLLCFFTIVLFTSCSDNNETNHEIDAIIFKDNSDTIEALLLKVDIVSGALEIDPSAIYTLENNSVLEISWIYPQYITEDILVLRQQPSSSSYESEFLSDDNATLFFEEYTLTYSSESFVFSLYKSGKLLYSDVPLKHGEIGINPTSFYVNEDGEVILLEMTSTSLIDTDMVSLVFSVNNKTLEIETFFGYGSFWDDYDISKTRCPNYLSDSVNVYACPQLQGFIYNETTKIFFICPYTGKTMCIIEENDITENMAFFDAHRDFYSLFNGVGYQDGIYAIVFQALNEIPGTYTAFFDDQRNYIGYLLCRNNCVILCNNSNEEVSRIDGTFLPMTYAPLY